MVLSDCIADSLFLGRKRSASSLRTCNTTEGGTDGHAYTGGITLTQHVASIDFASGVKVGRSLAIEEDTGVFVGLQAKVGESDAGTDWVGKEWWLVQRECPVGFLRVRTFGVTVVKDCVVKSAWLAS